MMPYLVRVPNPMLRAELANRLAERLRVDERLLRDELKRAAGAGKSGIQVRPEAARSMVTPAEKQLLRAFMENEELADEFLPALVENGDLKGLATEEVFSQLLGARRSGEKIEPSSFNDRLGGEAQRWAYESLFDVAEIPGRDEVVACLRALHRRIAERERDRLQAAIQAAEREKDQSKLAELLQAKAKLAKELSQMGKT